MKYILHFTAYFWWPSCRFSQDFLNSVPHSHVWIEVSGTKSGITWNSFPKCFDHRWTRKWQRPGVALFNSIYIYFCNTYYLFALLQSFYSRCTLVHIIKTNKNMYNKKKINLEIYRIHGIVADVFIRCNLPDPIRNCPRHLSNPVKHYSNLIQTLETYTPSFNVWHAHKPPCGAFGGLHHI